MWVVLLFVFLLVINGISIFVFYKGIHSTQEIYIFPAFFAIYVMIGVVVFAFSTVSQFFFIAYSMKEATYEAFIISSFGVAFLLSIYAFLMAFSASVRHYVVQRKSYLMKLNMVVFVLFVVSMFITPQYLFHRHHVALSLSIAPKAFHIQKVIYGYNTHTGFGGPSDWEMGLNIYQLPNDVVKRLDAEGIRFLNRLTTGQDCQAWHETPIVNEDGVVEGYAFLSLLGDSSEYDREIKQARNPVEKIRYLIGVKGNFYCHTQYGKLLIAPKEKWLVLYY